MSLEPAQLAEGRDWPTLIQFSVFLENRVGQMLEVVSLIETAGLAIVGLSVHDAADHAVVRLIANDSAAARRALQASKLPTTETELVAVQVPPGPKPLLQICSTLLRGELNIEYAYPLVMARQRPGLALHVDDPQMAAEILYHAKYRVIGEADLAV